MIYSIILKFAYFDNFFILDSEACNCNISLTCEPFLKILKPAYSALKILQVDIYFINLFNVFPLKNHIQHKILKFVPHQFFTKLYVSQQKVKYRGTYCMGITYIHCLIVELNFVKFESPANWQSPI